MKINHYCIITGASLLLASCQNVSEQVAQLNRNQDKYDQHTLSNYNLVTVEHLNLELNVNFDVKQLEGKASWHIKKIENGTKEIVFDTRFLQIDSVWLNGKATHNYALGKNDEILGVPLTINIEDKTDSITIFYKTKQGATALQWLEANQTLDKKHPFLYTQSQSIYARTWIPCQDGPGIRFTYNATVHTPQGMLALMSADNPKSKSSDGIYHFKMDKPIPAYLMALAVGDIWSKSINDQITVYAEKSLLNKAAHEIGETDQMMIAAEKLYGQYAWDKYDVLFMPPGFPFGGMENPRLTFSTPTILAGDRSLVNLIAHEMAHSWSGNLVTNASWNDFWLNEGFTVYFERRITEAMQGKSYVDMLWELGYQDLEYTVNKTFKDQPQFTQLQLQLNGIDPDNGMSDIAYEKGSLLLLSIENEIGRVAMDTFLNGYFKHFSFKTITTDAFLQYLDSTLVTQYPNLKKHIDFKEWIYGQGIPKQAIKVKSERFEKVDQVFDSFVVSKELPQSIMKKWSTHEWLHFLRKGYNSGLKLEELKILDQHFNLSNTSNAEIAMVWYVLSIEQNYLVPEKNMFQFLSSVGRMKFLEPIYEALKNSEHYKGNVATIFERNKPYYHPLTVKSIQQILQ